ncbi:MAG: L-seryl-tRNA(Sec) selenium transferase [Polyangiales bacterium]
MDARASLPAIGRLLAEPRVRALIERFGKASVTEALRRAVGRARDGSLGQDEGAVVAEASRTLDAGERGTLVAVINATGIVLHTNLGRAVLPQSALDAITRTGVGYSSLELDLATGERGSRHVHAADRLRRITGAEDALVANNAAAALMLSLSALAPPGETRTSVIVSRGELVEIGGAFRIPDIVESGGARLVEVGTTNRTRIGDYARALDATVGAPPVLLKVHRSNFAIVGFTEEASVAELVALSRSRPNAPRVVFDLGSGLMLPGRHLGLPDEPDVPAAVADGADVVVFSGDKLLGGPQAGLAVGRKDALAAMRRHPLMRAVRAGKLVLAALDAVLKTYERGARFALELPALHALTEPVDVVRARATSLAGRVGGSVIDSVARVGAGAQPTATIASCAVRLDDPRPELLSAKLRAGDPAIVGRIEDGHLLLDARTVTDAELETIVDAVTAARVADEPG